MFGSLRKIVRILRKSLGKSRSWQDENLSHLTHQNKFKGIEPSCQSPESVTAWKTATIETDEITTTQICVETATSMKTSANKIVKYWHGHGYLLFSTRNDVFWNAVYPLSFKWMIRFPDKVTWCNTYDHEDGSATLCIGTCIPVDIL